VALPRVGDTSGLADHQTLPCSSTTALVIFPSACHGFRVQRLLRGEDPRREVPSAVPAVGESLLHPNVGGSSGNGLRFDAVPFEHRYGLFQIYGLPKDDGGNNQIKPARISNRTGCGR